MVLSPLELDILPPLLLSKIRLEEFELPAMKDDEILAEVISDSLCMSSYKATKQGADHPRVPDNVAEAHPELEFVRPCTICPHMKKITLENTLASLQELKHEIFVEEEMRLKALRAVERMLEIGRKD